MGALKFLAFLAFLALASYGVVATDPTQLQDFCIGTNDPYNACTYLFLRHYYSKISLILWYKFSGLKKILLANLNF